MLNFYYYYYFIQWMEWMMSKKMNLESAAQCGNTSYINTTAPQTITSYHLERTCKDNTN